MVYVFFAKIVLLSGLPLFFFAAIFINILRIVGITNPHGVSTTLILASNVGFPRPRGLITLVRFQKLKRRDNRKALSDPRREMPWRHSIFLVSSFIPLWIHSLDFHISQFLKPRPARVRHTRCRGDTFVFCSRIEFKRTTSRTYWPLPFPTMPQKK